MRGVRLTGKAEIIGTMNRNKQQNHVFFLRPSQRLGSIQFRTDQQLLFLCVSGVI